ncbi:MAG: trypsin-like peptidase domain-containing protein, partial [Actinomycetota bacterium]
TFKIESVGCGGVVDGSGFPLDEHHVITAAHVVAGTSNHKVTDAEGHTVRATVVFINTDIDIAVLVVTAPPSPALQWTTRPADRRTDGAAIGYPGGGRRKISPARVRALTEAVGRDIYNRKLVSRQVYVLSALVRQGNSGGPFVDEDGVVRGMIFAASADDPNEAYALSATEIDRAMDAARGRSKEVNTGSCAL